MDFFSAMIGQKEEARKLNSDLANAQKRLTILKTMKSAAQILSEKGKKGKGKGRKGSSRGSHNTRYMKLYSAAPRNPSRRALGSIQDLASSFINGQDRTEVSLDSLRPTER